VVDIFVANEEPVFTEKTLWSTGINVQSNVSNESSGISIVSVGEDDFFEAGALGPCLGVSIIFEVSNLDGEEVEGVSGSTWNVVA
jgi:hypothetical protein